MSTSMKRRIASKLTLSAITMLVAATVILASCARQPTAMSAKLGQEFTLAPGQAAAITGESLQIRFLEVVNDSRCPTGVTCIWEGQVSCQVEVIYSGSPNRMTLVQPGSGQGKADFNDYSLTFNVQPYPEAEKQIAKQDYRLSMVIAK